MCSPCSPYSEHAWEVISEHATDLLDEAPLSPVARKPRTPTELAEKLSLTRTLSRRHSFVRSVSREQYKRSLSRSVPGQTHREGK